MSVLLAARPADADSLLVPVSPPAPKRRASVLDSLPPLRWQRAPRSPAPAALAAPVRKAGGDDK